MCWPLISMVAERAVRRAWTIFLDAGAGGVLQVASHGQGGEHDGQVGLDGLALVAGHGPGKQVALQQVPRSRTS
jgi:hypothetical protein